MLFLLWHEPQHHGKGKAFSSKDAALNVTSALAAISSATCAVISRKKQQSEGRLEGMEKNVAGE